VSPEVKLQDHITTKNIILFVDRPSLMLKNTITENHAHVYPVVMDVHFQFEAGSISVMGHHHPPTNSAGNTVCAALGKLLLEIFSMGRSASLNISLDTLNNNYGNSGEMLPPPEKRRATTMPTSNGFISAAAQGLLLELGMPMAICQLVCDLLDTENNEVQKSDMLGLGPCPNNLALTSVKEAFWDLTKMKTEPESYLFDRMRPQKASLDTCLFGNMDKQLFGRADETRSLMTLKNKISDYMNNTHQDSSISLVSNQGNSYLCETVFLSGYAGSGKSSLVNTLIHACNEDSWFVLGSKFDKQAAPHMILAKAFDEFFGKWRPANSSTKMKKSFSQVCRHIFGTLDDEGFRQLCGLVPNLSRIFPLLDTASNQDKDGGGISSMDKVGSAKKRLRSLFGVLVKSICSAGCPVLMIFDDLQWSESFVMEVITEFALNSNHDPSRVSDETCRRGLMIVGTYRNNEVKEDSDIFQSIQFMKESRKANVTMLNIGELTTADIIQLISAKLRLPWRYTKELAGLVKKKTRGNPFFVVQFLKSIIQNKTLSFSVKSRRWVWDDDVVDMQMITDGVAELLTSTFSQLPPKMMQAVKIASCLGSQVEESTINALNSRNELLSFNMQNEMQLAVREGIMETAGPVYQFTHDIVQQTIYELIPSDNRANLHKMIGMNLFKSDATKNNPTIHLLAMDQINIFCKGRDNHCPEEREQFAKNNVVAAKFAIAASSFEQARSYIDIGMQLLQTKHWETDYLLSLDIFEMSASISCINGDISNMSMCLDEILSHARTFNDSLKASSLLVKLLASMSKFDEARSNCLVILSNLGEVFPSNVSLPVVLQELSATQSKLRNITLDQIKSLPAMVNVDKLNVMKFLNMLCMYSIISKPLLLPLLSCRMVELSMEYGFCADSIVGLTTAGYSIFMFTEDIQLASTIGKVCETLVNESPMKHVLKSRLCNELYATLKMLSEPWQSVHGYLADLYNSAIMVGDAVNASICYWSYCAGGFFTGALDIRSVSNNLAMCIKEVAKYQQNTILYSTMGLVQCCRHLSGRNITDIDIKTYDELDEIGEKTGNAFLAWQNFNCRVSDCFWMREYMSVAEFSEKYSEKYPSSHQKRILQVICVFFEGIACFNLARDTKKAKWRILGERAVMRMKQFELMMLKCNLENKCRLLEAELYYLDGDLESAEAAYKASIVSAQKNRIINEEALACELYGIFCVENDNVNRGFKMLQCALGKYKQWGAMNKVNELQLFIELIDPGYLNKLKLM